jgi:hypothetical protein
VHNDNEVPEFLTSGRGRITMEQAGDSVRRRRTGLRVNRIVEVDIR